uniref:Minor glycoprotein n=1 Tax=Kibale red colobus virus 1 TaxID=1885929 RepID=X2D756_9NIDO|nr:minor glycoprotein [Kibale red colobus virus 1]
MPISCPSLLAYFQWHTSSASLRSISGTRLSAFRAWLLLYPCYLCLPLCHSAASEKPDFEVYLPSSDLSFNATLVKQGCYLLGSVGGAVQATYDTCPIYGSVHSSYNDSVVISEPTAFNYALLIAALEQTATYPGLYNASNVTVTCDNTKCSIRIVKNTTSHSCLSRHFSFAEDAMLVVAQLYLPPAVLLALALLIAL